MLLLWEKWWEFQQRGDRSVGPGGNFDSVDVSVSIP